MISEFYNAYEFDWKKYNALDFEIKFYGVSEFQENYIFKMHDFGKNKFSKKHDFEENFTFKKQILKKKQKVAHKKSRFDSIYAVKCA